MFCSAAISSQLAVSSASRFAASTAATSSLKMICSTVRLGGVVKAGYNETALTSLSTADYSCITPLITRVMKELRPHKVSVSVSSITDTGTVAEACPARMVAVPDRAV